MSDDLRSTRILLWGGKTKARIAQEMIREAGLGTTAIIFDSTIDAPEFETSAHFVSRIAELKARLPELTHFVVCIGGEHGYARYMTARHLEQAGLKPISLVHARSFVEPTSTVGSGCHLMPLAVVHKFSRVGDQTILNTHSTVEHECVVGNGVHIMVGAALAGRVTVGDYATIGTNATVLPFLTVGEGAYVGAGAVVTRNVEPNSVVAGTPAKVLRKMEHNFNDELLRGLKS